MYLRTEGGLRTSGALLVGVGRREGDRALQELTTSQQSQADVLIVRKQQGKCWNQREEAGRGEAGKGRDLEPLAWLEAQSCKRRVKCPVG